MFVSTSALLSFLVISVEVKGQCYPTATNGCLDGESFDFSSQFACGSMNDGYIPIYDLSSMGCCAQGLPYVKSSQYCCFDGVHDYTAGYCGAWSSSASDAHCFDCTETNYFSKGGASKLNRSSKLKSDVTLAPIDTSVLNTGDYCTTSNSVNGCLNSYYYDYNIYYPCRNWLLSYVDYGCCDRTPYLLDTDSCCFDPNSGISSVTYGDPHACSCTQYGCL